MSEALLNDRAAEEAVLGALLIDPAGFYRVLPIVKEQHFSGPYRPIFAAIHALSERREPVDFVTVVNELEAKQQLRQVGGAAEVSRLGSLVPSAANVEAYARQVRAAYLRREMLRVAAEIARLAHDGEQDVSAALDAAETALFRVRNAGATARELVTFETLAGEVFERLVQAREQRGGPALLTGYGDLDAKLGGLYNTDLLIVAARPRLGKSALLGNIALRAALDGKHVAMFNLEMSNEQFFNRLLVNQGYATSQQLRAGNMSDAVWEQVSGGVDAHSRLPIWSSDTPALSIGDLRARALRLQMEHGCDLLCVDYVQLMRAGCRTHSRQQEIGVITRGLKALAKELRVPVLAAAQLNRQAEGARPTLAHLREAGDIENDADVVMLIHRNPDTPGKVTRAKIIIAKHRHGPTGDVALGWYGSRMAFVPLQNPGGNA